MAWLKMSELVLELMRFRQDEMRRMVAEAESFVETDVLDAEIVLEDVLDAEFVG